MNCEICNKTQATVVYRRVHLCAGCHASQSRTDHAVACVMGEHDQATLEDCQDCPVCKGKEAIRVYTTGFQARAVCNEDLIGCGGYWEKRPNGTWRLLSISRLPEGDSGVSR